MLDPSEWQAIRLTLIVSAISVVSTLPVAIALGWLLAKRNFVGKSLVEVLINLPLVMPPVVTGFLIMVAFGRQSTIGWLFESYLGIRFVFDWKGAALASAVVGFPLLIRPIRIAFEQVDDRLLYAARTLGANRFDAFITVALPLARSGIYAGCILAFARSMGEFGATIMIAGSIPGETQTISLMIYSLLDSPGGIRLSIPLVVASISLSAIAIFAGEKIERKYRNRQYGMTN